jgi:hypothetical protein
MVSPQNCVWKIFLWKNCVEELCVEELCVEELCVEELCVEELCCGRIVCGRIVGDPVLTLTFIEIFYYLIFCIWGITWGTDLCVWIPKSLNYCERGMICIWGKGIGGMSWGVVCCETRKFGDWVPNVCCVSLFFCYWDTSRRIRSQSVLFLWWQ